MELHAFQGDRLRERESVAVDVEAGELHDARATGGAGTWRSPVGVSLCRSRVLPELPRYRRRGD